MPKLADIIRYDNMPDDVMAARWMEGEAGVIPWGSQLIVQQGQVAVFYRDGNTMEVFNQGRYMLTTQNVPILTKFITGLAYGGGNTPFHATVYFVNTKPFLDCRWGTTAPVYMFDAGLNSRIPVRANGRFSVEVNNASIFCARLVGTKPLYRTSDVEQYLRETHIIPTLTSLLARLKKPFHDLVADQVDVAMGAKAMLGETLTPFGLALVDMSILSITTTEEIEALLRRQAQATITRQEREALGASNAVELGQLEMMKGIGAGQAKGGGGAGAPVAESGMAMMMPMMMMQMMQNMQAQKAPAPAAAPVATAPAAPSLDPVARLEKLKELKGLLDAGVINQDEFNALKADIFKK